MPDNFKFYIKRPLLVFNIFIAVCYLIVAIPLIVVMATCNPPSDLKTATGTIAEIKHNEKSDPNIIDHLANDTASYFDITFTDGSFFHAIGIRYNNIDEKLFSDISVGTEITVSYEDKGFSAPNNLYGIEYNGITYLDTDVVMAEFMDERQSTITGCSIAIAVITVLAGVAVTVNFIKNRHKNSAV